MAAIASQSSRVSALPHGLCGELMMSSLLRSVISPSSSSVSMRKPLRSRSGPGIGIEHLVALVSQGEDAEEHYRLGARRDDDAVRGPPHPAGALEEGGHG